MRRPAHTTAMFRRQIALFQAMIVSAAVCLIVISGTDAFNIVLDGHGIVRPLLWVMLCPMLLIMAIYYRFTLSGAVASFEISVLILLTLLSFLWSLDPSNTIERAIPLIVTTCFAFMIASMTSQRSLILLLAATCCVMMFLSLASIAIFPQARGTPPWDTTWRGIFNHKNGMGAASALSLFMTYAAMKLSSGNTRRLFLAGFVASIALLYASESRTAQFVGLFSFIAIYLAFSNPRKPLSWALGYWLAFCGLLASGTLLLGSSLADPIFALIDRKPTLSSRIPLWELLWPYIQDRFWLGYGYSAFWYDSSPYPPIIANHPSLRFQPFYSHNGLVEVWLHIGFAGVALLTLLFLRLGYAFYLCMRYLSNPICMVILLVVVINFLMLNITEGTVLDRKSIIWMIFVAAVTKTFIVARSVLQSKGTPSLVCNQMPSPRP